MTKRPTANKTAPDPEGDPPYPIHPAILSMVTSGDLSDEFLDMFYEGYLVYVEAEDAIWITRRGRDFVKTYQEGQR